MKTSKKINLIVFTVFTIFAMVTIMPVISYTVVASNEADLTNKVTNIDDIENTVEEGSVEGVPVFANGIECFEYAYNKLMNAVDFSASCSGVTTTSAGTVTNYAFRSIDQNGYGHSYSHATGKMNVPGVKSESSKQYYFYKFDVNSNVYKEENDKIVDKNTPYFEDKFEVCTFAEQTKLTGIAIGDTQYIINKNTVLETVYFNKTNKGYTFKFLMDTNTATINLATFYAYHSRKYSPSRPIFSKAECTVFVGFDGNFQKIVYTDVYAMSALGIKSSNSTVYSETYKFNANIPLIQMPK